MKFFRFLWVFIVMIAGLVAAGLLAFGAVLALDNGEIVRAIVLAVAALGNCIITAMWMNGPLAKELNDND